MYTPYNMFYQELPEAKTGIETEDEYKVGDIIDHNGKKYKVTGIDTATNKPILNILDERELRFVQYQDEKLKPASEKGWTIRKSKTTYDPYGTQIYDPKSGGYTYNKQPLDWNDFKERHQELIESELGIPYDEWEKQVKSPNEATREAATLKFQEGYNKWYKEATGEDYFSGDTEKLPYGKDKKPGIYTTSAPGLVKPKPEKTTSTPQLATTPKKDETVNFITGAKLQQPPLPRMQPEFWKQDLVSMINAGMDWASIKKYLPWAKPVDLQEAQYTLLDPTWQLQQNAGLLNQQIEGLGAFGTPQSYVSNLSSMAGKAGDQARNILSEYDTKNAMLQTEGEARNIGIRNQEEMLNTEIATNLYDKTTMANQQFDNAQRAARNNMALAYNNALTNRAMTQSQNLMSAPFQVDPSTGGYVFFDERLTNDIVPSQSDFEIKQKRIDDILRSDKYKGQDLESIYKLLYGDETLGYPAGRQPRRRQQQYRPTYQEMMMMYPGATGADPYGYIG